MKKDMRRETTANNSTHISTGSTWMTNEYNANVRKTDEERRIPETWMPCMWM